MKVLITHTIPDIAIKLLKENGIEFHIEKEGFKDIQSLSKRAKDYDALLNVGMLNYDAGFFEQNKHLKGIALFSAGYDHIDLEAAKEHQVKISNTPDAGSKSTADLAFLLIQATARNAFFHYRRIIDDQLDKYDTASYLGFELEGKTLGIFGMGRIGFELGQLCQKAFDMNIIYHNRSPKPEFEKDLEAVYVSFEELLEQSDVISIHANLSEETQHQFDKKAFSKMKSTAIIVNAARGPLIHEEDLITALEEKEIWGAGLDVSDPEPMRPDNPLLKMSNVCVLPHIGAATVEARNDMAKLAAENIIALSKGEKMPTEIKE